MFNKRFFYVLLAAQFLTALIVPAIVTPVNAQSVCANGYIIDEVGNLDVSSICAALKPWSAKNIVVLVYQSNQQFSSENDWYATLDAAEASVDCQPGSPCHQGDKLYPNFMAIEFTRDASWVEITVGDDLYSSKMEPNRGGLKLQLQNGVSNNPSEAVLNVLNQGYAYAFPAPVQQQNEPYVAPTPMPTPIPVDWTPVKQGAKTAGYAFLCIVMFVVIGFVYLKAIIPAMAIKKQITRVTDILNRWVIFAEAFFGKEGIKPENSQLYINFKIAGVQAYPDIDKKVLGWIGECLEAFKYMRENLGHLIRRDTDETKGMLLSERAKEFEILWLTFAGTSDKVINLTDAQIKQLLEPLMDMPVTGTNSALVDQLKDQSSRLKSGPLKVSLMYAKRSDVRSSDGILGIIMKLKDSLEELKAAADGAGPAVSGAKLKREKAGTRPFPDGLTPDQALAQVDALLKQADSDLEKRLYIHALRIGNDVQAILDMFEKARVQLMKAEAVRKTLPATYKPKALGPTIADVTRTPNALWLKAIESAKSGKYDISERCASDLQLAISEALRLIPLYHAALLRHQDRLASVKRITDVGFTVPALVTGLKEVANDVRDFITAIADGNYGQAENLVKEIDADSGVILAEAESLRKIHSDNENALKRLAVEVARVSKVADLKDADLRALQAYAKSNWLDLSRNMTDARAALSRLFDDPSDANDVASRIDRMNSMKEQAFKKAEAELLSAFEALRQAEKLLNAISERLVAVQSAEKTVAQALEVVRKAHAILVGKRDQYDPLIGKEVDNAIANAREVINDAENQIARKEYLVSEQNVIKAREIVNAATVSATTQVDRLTRLMKETAALKAAMVDTVRDAVRAYADSIAASRTTTAADIVEQAEQLSKTALRKEALAQGLEDAAYASALQAFADALNQAIAMAKKATEQVTQDAKKYTLRYDEVSEYVAEVAKLVASALKKVKHDDVGRHAESAADRAKQLLPSMPAKGATYAELTRVMKAAESAKSEAQDAIKRANKDIEEAAEESSYSSPSVIVFNNNYSSPLSTTHRDTSSYTPMSSVHRSSSPSLGSSHRSSTPNMGSVHRGGMGGVHR